MNRRDNLKSLLALGASFTLPAVGSFPTALASPALIDTLGDQSLRGDHPGSSYFAAELHVPIEEVNAAARAADIPIRFRGEA